MRRILIGGVLAGLVIFLHGFVAHMLLPLGEAGVSSLSAPAEEALRTALDGGPVEPGLYLFPGYDTSREMSDAEMQEWAARYRQGPSGLLVLRPSGGDPLGPTQLGGELFFNVLCGLVLAVLLWNVPASLGYARRVGLATLVGLFGALDIDASYWVWYCFPTSYFLAQTTMAVGGALFAGLVVARICRR